MLIVGAPGNADSSSSQTRVGKVYVYQPTQAGWVYQEQLVPWLWRVPQQFGSSLATSSNHLLVGAPFCGERGSRSGAVYAFEFNGRDWLPRQFLLPDEDSQDSFFGSAVAVNDNRALVGATGTGLHTFFHFERGLWLEHQRMLISRGVPSLSDSQTSIALQSGLAVVGDFRENADGFQSGAAYLLRLRGQTWSSERKLVPANLAAYDRFGYSVAMDDRRNLIIGSPNNTGGAAHLYPLADLLTGDSDLDGVLTVSDGAAFLSCTSGPQATDESNLPFGCLATFDFDGDADIDLADLAAFQRGFGCSE